MKNLFAARIRELRREAGLSQEQLAAKYGLSVQAVSKWECAQSYPDIELLVELAEQFGVTVDSLLREDAPPAADHHSPVGPPVNWPDDGELRVVQFVGRRMVGTEEFNTNVRIPLLIEEAPGSTINVEIWGSADIKGNISGDMSANGGVNCGNVGGDLGVNGGVNCGNVGGDLKTGSGVNCGNVGGDMSAGGGVNCGDIKGDATVTGGDLHCHCIQGDARCDGNILYDR